MKVDFNTKTITCKCGHVELFGDACLSLCPCCKALFYECGYCRFSEEMPGDKQKYIDHEDLTLACWDEYRTKSNIKKGFKFFQAYRVRSSCVV